MGFNTERNVSHITEPQGMQSEGLHDDRGRNLSSAMVGHIHVKPCKPFMKTRRRRWRGPTHINPLLPPQYQPATALFTPHISAIHVIYKQLLAAAFKSPPRDETGGDTERDEPLSNAKISIRNLVIWAMTGGSALWWSIPLLYKVSFLQFCPHIIPNLYLLWNKWLTRSWINIYSTTRGLLNAVKYITVKCNLECSWENMTEIVVITLVSIGWAFFDIGIIKTFFSWIYG